MTRFSIATRFGACALSVAAATAHAGANFTNNAYEAAKDDIKATFKAEKRACERLEGNAREVCTERAKGGERIALARLELERTGSADDEIRLFKAQYEAHYEVEKQRCAERSGTEKDICEQEARTRRDKAEADTKMARRINQAVEDDERARLKADYELAREKCNALNGRAKDACVDAAKARHAQGW